MGNLSLSWRGQQDNRKEVRKHGNRQDSMGELSKKGVVIHLRNYYFLTTFHSTDLTHFDAFCLNLAMMKMSRG